MTDEDEEFENAEMEDFDDQEKEVAKDNVIKEKIVEQENVPKEKQENGDLKGKGEEGKHEVKRELKENVVVKDEKEKNGGFESPKGVEESGHDLKKKEEREDVVETKNQVEKELVKEDITKGVIKEGETKKIENEKDESKKVDMEKDEQKNIENDKNEPKSIDKEKDEPKKIDKEKDESKNIDKEKDEPKKISEENDEPKKIDKEKDEPKKIDKENDESKKTVKEKDEPQKISEEKDESKKMDKEKDEPKKVEKENDKPKKIDKETDEPKKVDEKDESKKEGEKNIRSHEENGEAKEEKNKKDNGVDQENSESKKVDEEKNKKDQEKNVSKKEDEMKESGDKENGGSEKEDEKKEEERDDAISCNVDVNNVSFKEQANQFSELKESEKMALVEIKMKLEEAIQGNRLFKDILQRKGSTKPKEKLEGIVQEAIKKQHEESNKLEGVVQEAIKKKQEENKKAEEGEKKPQEKQEQEEKENKENPPTEEKKDEVIEEENEGPNLDISLWGIPLLPSKADKQTDVLLLKFLRARDYKAGEAFEMLRSTLQWRKQNNIDSILDEDFANDFSPAAYMSGKDNEGHPVCYNIFGALDNIEMYNKTLSSEEKQERFLRWRIQLMEKGIQNLDFSPTGVSSLMQVSDLKNTPGPSKKEVRLSAKQGVSLLLDNYPEFVAKHIFINVPFWYYAFTAVLSPFLNPRTKSKFVYARPAKVTETLLKYIAIEDLPVQYGGLKRENDSEFSLDDNAIEVPLKSSSTETIELLAPEAGRIIWDLIVLGWEVGYKEEFVPNDEGSYTIIVQKGRKIGTQEVPIRNSFRSNEPGKIVITMDNSSFKKKRVFYRYKINTSSSSS